MIVVVVEEVDAKEEVVVEIVTEIVGVEVVEEVVAVMIVEVEVAVVDLIGIGREVEAEEVVMGINHEVMGEVVVLVVEAEGEVMEVIEDIIKEAKVVVVVVAEEVEVAVVLTRVVVVTVAAVVPIMQEAVVKVRCRVTTHKVVGIIRAGVINRDSNKDNNNRHGVNKDGAVRDSNQAGELRVMDSGVMVNSQEQIQTSRPRLTMQQHGELIILVPGLIGASSTVNNINSGMVSRLPDSTHRPVPPQALLQQVRQELEPLEHRKTVDVYSVNIVSL